MSELRKRKEKKRREKTRRMKCEHKKEWNDIGRIDRRDR